MAFLRTLCGGGERGPRGVDLAEKLSGGGTSIFMSIWGSSGSMSLEGIVGIGGGGA